MTNQTAPSSDRRSSLKEATGWFAAGDGFRKALGLLSDGAFKLFAHICLEADRQAGRFRSTHKDLATTLRKSKRAIGAYVAEIEAAGICLVKPGKNQFEGTLFEIADTYWPYQRVVAPAGESLERENYVESIRACFLGLGCGSDKFTAADIAIARELYRRSIPSALVEQAMLLGACRKYMSWFEGRALEPIQSLAYFSLLIAEIQEKPFPPGYSCYLRWKVKQLAKSWNESTKTVISSTAEEQTQLHEEILQ